MKLSWAENQRCLELAAAQEQTRPPCFISRHRSQKALPEHISVVPPEPIDLDA